MFNSNSDYNTNEQKIKPLTEIEKQIIQSVTYLHGLMECKFVPLNKNSRPIKAYKKKERIPLNEALNAIIQHKDKLIGIVPKTIGMWVFIKTDKWCQFKDPHPISYEDSNGWRQFWYGGNIGKSFDPYRCNLHLDDMGRYCGRVIHQDKYVTLSGKDLIALANKLSNSGLYNENGTLQDPDYKPELSRYFVKDLQKHVDDRSRSYQNATREDMIKIVKSALPYNAYPIIRYLLMEVSIRNHERIKSGEVKMDILDRLLKQWLEHTRESVNLSPKEQKEVVMNAYNFAKTKYGIKRDHPEHHLRWIMMYEKLNMTITQIAEAEGCAQSTVSEALDKKYGAHKPKRRNRSK